MRKLSAVLVLAGLSFATGLAQTPGQLPTERLLQITFEGSDVSLVAQNVSVPEILREWARLSGCVIVNAERLSAARLVVPMRFEKQPQTVVLQALLRSAAGYIATPRTAKRAGATDFELIYILPTSNPTQGGYSGMSSPVQAPITGVETEIPPIPAPPQQPPAAGQEAPPPPRTNPTSFSPVVPIMGVPSTTQPPPATGRGRGGF